MSYIKLSITTHPNNAEPLSDNLFELGALSVSFQDAKDEPIFQIQPGETPLWQHTKVDALFEETVSIETIIKALNTENPDLTDIEFYVEKIEDQDWVRITQQQFQPKQYANTLWICPTYYDSNELTGTVVKIDPGLAFGTGTHPTTSLCLTWLAENPPKNKTVIDYGCGSGILSLAALALGAKTVYATDHDAQALTATKNNADLNDFCNPKILKISPPEKCHDIKSDIILANILANPLIELAPKLISLLKPGGTLILSGILENEIDSVSAAYETVLQKINTTTENEWVRLVFTY